MPSLTTLLGSSLSKSTTTQFVEIPSPPRCHRNGSPVLQSCHRLLCCNPVTCFDESPVLQSIRRTKANRTNASCYSLRKTKANRTNASCYSRFATQYSMQPHCLLFGGSHTSGTSPPDARLLPSGSADTRRAPTCSRSRSVASKCFSAAAKHRERSASFFNFDMGYKDATRNLRVSDASTNLSFLNSFCLLPRMDTMQPNSDW